MHVLPTGLVVLTLAVAASAQEPKPAPLGCDTTAIRWFKPGEFADALDKAKKDRRLLIIKGISFGVDDVGAKCATKGKW